jgi:hypothetical protein
MPPNIKAVDLTPTLMSSSLSWYAFVKRSPTASKDDFSTDMEQQRQDMHT